MAKPQTKHLIVCRSMSVGMPATERSTLTNRIGPLHTAHRMRIDWASSSSWRRMLSSGLVQNAHGLEPHQIIRLLGSLGAKEKEPPLQVLMTTHSPVALRELAGDQLFIVRPAMTPPCRTDAIGVRPDMAAR